MKLSKAQRDWYMKDGDLRIVCSDGELVIKCKQYELTPLGREAVKGTK